MAHSPAVAPPPRGSGAAGRVLHVENKTLEGLDVLGVEMLLRPRDEPVLDPVAQAHPHAEPLAGLPVAVLDLDERAGVVGLVNDAQWCEFFFVERRLDEHQALAEVFLAERARDERHREAVDVDRVEDVLGEVGERALEIACAPALEGSQNGGTLVVDRHARNGPPCGTARV